MVMSMTRQAIVVRVSDVEVVLREWGIAGDSLEVLLQMLRKQTCCCPSCLYAREEADLEDDRVPF